MVKSKNKKKENKKQEQEDQNCFDGVEKYNYTFLKKKTF